MVNSALGIHQGLFSKGEPEVKKKKLLKNQRSVSGFLKGRPRSTMFFRTVFQQGLRSGVRYQSTSAAAKAQNAASNLVSKITGM